MREPDPGEPNPRAFVTATGFVFQIVGLLFASCGCVLWSLSGFFQPEAAQPIETAADYFKADTLARGIGLIDFAVTFVGGIGLLAAGLGMQSERRDSGAWAVVVCTVLAVAWWASLVGYLIAEASWWMPGVALVLACACSVLFLLAGNSARILRQHPPPRDLNIVSDEFLEKYDRHRPD